MSSIRADEFQFPSNGKVYPKLGISNTPFYCNGFQFPSNGKVYPKVSNWVRCRRWWRRLSFNSLQTGKCIQRYYLLDSSYFRISEFQFPSNGKVYPKRRRRIFVVEHRRKVSIPFKRESVSKAFADSGYLVDVYACFNSLQTGKCIQSSSGRNFDTLSWKSFNSLQTGKCIQSYAEPRFRRLGACFNSLQTGKCIQSFQL